MAEVEVKDSGKGGKKGQQKKMKIHVDRKSTRLNSSH